MRRLDAWLYPGISGSWDNSLFRKHILENIAPSQTILDLGAGAGIVADMNFRGLARCVYGIDVDTRVTANPYLDRAYTGSAERLPFDDETFDLIFSANVMEHLNDPLQVFREASRVLKPGGSLLFKTPNARHYMPLIARLTPHSFHVWLNARRGREAPDTFPTRYRANSAGRIAALARHSGLDIEAITFVEKRPEYLRFHPALYACGFAYERFVNSSTLFASLRIVLIASLRKPARPRGVIQTP